MPKKFHHLYIIKKHSPEIPMLLQTVVIQIAKSLSYNKIAAGEDNINFQTRKLQF